MLDALNAIVEFFNMIFGTAVSFVYYIGDLFSFISVGSGMLLQFIDIVPPYMTAFAVLTLTLSIVLLIVGRSNNRG